MRDLSISGIIIGIICSVMAAIMVLSGGKFLAVAEGWARAANLAFLFSISCSLVSGMERKEDITDKSEDFRTESKDKEESEN